MTTILDGTDYYSHRSHDDFYERGNDMGMLDLTQKDINGYLDLCDELIGLFGCLKNMNVPDKVQNAIDTFKPQINAFMEAIGEET
ncbi:MAG: hypothetical protein EOM59_11760 [Clostridia bacterium]|nr:hypothetical protein [Clostridia bacterium]